MSQLYHNSMLFNCADCFFGPHTEHKLPYIVHNNNTTLAFVYAKGTEVTYSEASSNKLQSVFSPV